jgi:poly(hydroxyalkanoate) depolymerase family esterase
MQVLAIASISLGLLAAAPARAASLTMVPRATWGPTSSVPSYMQMYIYVPDRLAAKPPILVSSHSCGSTASGQMGNITKIKAAADANGFILILPDSSPMRNCWDVGTTASLTHNGGGDTLGVVQMVKYALSKYNGDPARVYAHGGSSGGMMTQALMAVYPDVFRAGAARAGVPAGCWADGYDPSQQWSNNCAGGNTIKTAQQWGDLVRNMYPGYTGHRPRVQTMQGEADPTISYKNTGESIKEWTNVLGLPMTPSSMDTGYKAANATYDRQFWKNACGYVVFEAWSSPGGTHSMPYEEADILKFLGLDTARDTDPEPDCTGGTGTGGSGGTGAGGSGGSTGAGGAQGRGGSSGSGGVQGGGGRGGSVGPGTGGSVGTGGGPGTGGSVGSGGSVGAGGSAVTGSGGGPGTGGATGSGGTGAGGSAVTGSGGSVGAGGSAVTGSGGSNATGSGGATGTGGSNATGGNGSGATGTGGSTPPPGDSSSGGCAVGGGAGRSLPALAFLVGAFAVVRRRRRRSRG